MMTFNRRHASLAMLASLAACGSSGPSSAPAPQFKRYSGPPVTQVAVYKGQRRMHLLNGQTVLRSYDFGLGNQPVGPSSSKATERRPRGCISSTASIRAADITCLSAFPTPTIRTRLTPHSSVEVRERHHVPRAGSGGNALAPRNRDWTAGCLALTDQEIEDVYAMLQPGTR